jgi:molybdopterin/thiamine biosynthesis adenylyltransferase
LRKCGTIKQIQTITFKGLICNVKPTFLISIGKSKTNKYFDDYIKDLAYKCGFDINGDKEKVEKIICEEWYTDGTVKID